MREREDDNLYGLLPQSVDFIRSFLVHSYFFLEALSWATFLLLSSFWVSDRVFRISRSKNTVTDFCHEDVSCAPFRSSDPHGEQRSSNCLSTRELTSPKVNIFHHAALKRQHPKVGLLKSSSAWKQNRSD